MAPRSKALVRHIAGPDADEVEALAYAAATLKDLSPSTHNPEAVASAVISKWIIERTKRDTSRRLTETLVFDLKNAHMRGTLEAALPQLGEALAGLPANTPFFELPKDEVIDVFMAGIFAWRAGRIANGENPNFPLDDPIPFGDA